MAGSKKFEIKITEIGSEVRTGGKEWEPIKQSTATDGSKGEKEWGYTPEIQKTVTYTREIFKQTVDDLDMSAVVSVVNKINQST